MSVLFGSWTWWMLAWPLPGGLAEPAPVPDPAPIVGGTDAAACQFPATVVVLEGDAVRQLR